MGSLPTFLVESIVLPALRINFPNHSFSILGEVSRQVVKSIGLQSISTFLLYHGACQLKGRLEYNSRDPNSWA